MRTIKDCRVDTLVRAATFLIALVVLSGECRPFASNLKPIYSINSAKKVHFSFVSTKPTFWSRGKTSWSAVKWLSWVGLVIRISIRHAHTKDMPLTIMPIMHWKNSGTELTQTGSRLYQDKPRWLLIAVAPLASSSNVTWFKTCFESNAVNWWPSTKEA